MINVTNIIDDSTEELVNTKELPSTPVKEELRLIQDIILINTDEVIEQ